MPAPAITLDVDAPAPDRGPVRYRWVDQDGRDGHLYADPDTTRIWRDGPDPLTPDSFVTAAGVLRRHWRTDPTGPLPAGLPEHVTWQWHDPGPTIRRDITPVPRDRRGRVEPSPRRLGDQHPTRGTARPDP